MGTMVLQESIYILGKTRVDSYIAARYRRPTSDLPIRHVRYICLRNRPAEDKLSYPVGRIIILSEDSPDIG